MNRFFFILGFAIVGCAPSDEPQLSCEERGGERKTQMVPVVDPGVTVNGIKIGGGVRLVPQTRCVLPEPR